jgi:predicted Fe-Mo cluster-binding NifX family protein
MRIAIPTATDAHTAAVEPRFARAAVFLLHDTDSGSWEAVDNAQVLNAPQGAGIQAAETLARHQIQAVLTAHCGPKAFRALQAAGIAVYINVSGSAEQAVADLLAGNLQLATGPDVEGHW